jgi:hypothetical protein
MGHENPGVSILVPKLLLGNQKPTAFNAGQPAGRPHPAWQKALNALKVM